MNSASAILYALAGEPSQDHAEPITGRCWVCASECGRGVPVARWQGANFTDQNKARCPEGTHVCEPCVWAMAWNQPPGFPPPAPGKKGLNLRLFSHLHDSRGYTALNKADKPAIRAWLRGTKRGPWFAAIADTGQKHVLPWTPVNPAGGHGGVVRFEERNVPMPATADGWRVLVDVTDMLTWGVTKNEILRGEYTSTTYRGVPKHVIDTFESTHGRLRGGAWLELVTWISQRDEAKHANRRDKSRGAEKRDRQRAPGVARSVPRKRGEPAQALAAVAGPHADGGQDKRERAGLGDGDGSGATAVSSEQLSLFGDPRIE